MCYRPLYVLLPEDKFKSYRVSNAVRSLAGQGALAAVLITHASDDELLLEAARSRAFAKTLRRFRKAL